MPVDLLPSGKPAPAKPFVVTGRFVLFALIAFFLVVATVNGIMMTMAIKTFPGIDARNGYDVSQGYNREIAAARRQAERGWQSHTALANQGAGAQLVMTLTDRDGAAVTGLALEARIKHPSDRRRDVVVGLTERAAGRYSADLPAVSEGSWGIHIEGTLNGERVFVSDSKALIKS